MDPITAAALGLGAIQTVTGLVKASKNKRPKKNTTVASELYDNANYAKGMAASGTMPGYTTAKQNLESSFANSANNIIRTVQSPNAISAAIAALNQQKANALSSLEDKNSEYRNRMSERAMGANAAIAQAKTAAYRDNFEYNEHGKYNADAAAASALIGGGITNITTGLSRLDEDNRQNDDKISKTSNTRLENGLPKVSSGETSIEAKLQEYKDLLEADELEPGTTFEQWLSNTIQKR